MNLLLASMTIGFILSLLALGVYISFRTFRIPDITVDGSLPLGAAVTAILIVRGVHPVLATAAGFGAGCLAGTVTGILHTFFKINSLLSGILVMTALYSVNLHIMGRSNVPLLSETTLTTLARNAAEGIGAGGPVCLFGWEVGREDLAVLAGAFMITVLVAGLLYAFLKTNLGTAMRATGDNPDMIRALGVNTGRMTVLGLCLANGLVALSGALLAQYQGFADVQMGIGMVVWGLASVIIGEALVGSAGGGIVLTGVIMGSILFRLLVAIALRWGLNPNDLKLITAVFVFIALIVPRYLSSLRKRKRSRPDA